MIADLVACGDDDGVDSTTDTTTSGTETAGTLGGSSSSGTGTSGPGDTTLSVELDGSGSTASGEEMLSTAGSTSTVMDAASSSGDDASDSSGSGDVPNGDDGGSSTGAAESEGSSDSSTGGGEEMGDASTGFEGPSPASLCEAACAQAASAGCDDFNEDACFRRCFSHATNYVYYLTCYEEFRAARECEATMEYTCPGTMDPGTCAAEQQAVLGCS